MSKRILLPIACLLLPGQFARPVLADPTPEQVDLFEKKIRPLLVEHCHKCHSGQAKKLKGELLLDSRAGLLKGGEGGRVIVPGQPDNSRLIEAISYKNPDLQMPPRGKLPDGAIAELTAWVKMGAPWPKEKVNTSGNRYVFNLQERKRKHWCWQPLHPEGPPAVKDTTWPRDSIDRFILAKLEAKGLKPADAADRRTLIRRLYFDLIGLPPEPAEVEAFVADVSAEPYAKVVDRLLASPHFGERWGRHWLDLVRYAESRGHEYDYTLPNAFQYRDYVIRAFNADVPYNQFVLEHIAGDLLPRARLNPEQGFNESILGTGYWFLGEQVHSPVDTCQDKADRFDNMLDVMSKTFLGLTVSCARCHDHKFDAISTKDYYSLCGFLESSSYRLVHFDSLEHNRQIAEKLWAVRERAQPAIHKALAQAIRPGLSRVADYLLAARTAHQKGDAPLLNADLLGRWVAHLAAAARNADDPMHAWTLEPKQRSALLESWKKRDAQADAYMREAEVIVDYSRPGPESWIQDGFAFGPRPVRPGDLRLGGVVDRPEIGIYEIGAAIKDRAWDGLRLTAGAEVEPGSPGGMIGSGRMLRTPTFRVKAGPVFYLMKGKGRVYAAVDAHVMIAGPLHGQLVQQLDAGPTFRWMRHDLSRYKGSPAHIEFVPENGSNFAVAMVVQADNSPVLLDRPNRALLDLLSTSVVLSAEALAGRYQQLLTGVANRLEAARTGNPATARDDARLASWMLHHLELFTPDEKAARNRLAEIARPFLAEQAQLEAQIRKESRLAPAMLDGNGFDEHVFIRGSYKTPGEPAPRRFVEALVGEGPMPVEKGSGRLQLARQMIDPKITPLVPRVVVNRVWHHLFGRGIVASVDNFGVLGELPTHPELLEYLADRFVKEGWSVKKLMRELVLSSTYRMSSQPNEEARQADPQEQWLYRMRIRRLEGEAIRDAILALSGRLDRRRGGPSVPVHLTPFQEGRGRPASGPLDGAGRRSLYLAARRNFLSPFLLTFDTPIPFSTVGKRTVSNVPAQALIMMNDPFVHQQAELWARKVLARPGTARERITGMYLSAFSRPPTADELAACLEFLDSRGQHVRSAPNELSAWTSLAHVLFNAKEFLFLN
jgi:hypothetical protein